MKRLLIAVILAGSLYTLQVGCQSVTVIRPLHGQDFIVVAPGSSFTAPTPPGVTNGYWLSDRALHELYGATVDERNLK